MKRALIVGINTYEHANALHGCVNDAQKMEALVARNSDNTKNFDTKLVTSDNTGKILKKDLTRYIDELLGQPADMALFYFSGHGTATNLGGYLCTYEAEKYNEGYPMQDLVSAIRLSKVKEVVVILDCCESGAMGQVPALDSSAASIREGVSILTASRQNQSAIEVNGSGVFTSLVCDALSGGAADLRGIVTPAGVYAHVEHSFGEWGQRPLFKSFVSRSTPMRTTGLKVPFEMLLELPNLFPTPEAAHNLNPSYERTHKTAKPENVVKFKMFKKLQTVGLIKVNHEPDPDLYWASIESESCQLTALGQFYWHLVKSKKI